MAAMKTWTPNPDPKIEIWVTIGVAGGEDCTVYSRCLDVVMHDSGALEFTDSDELRHWVGSDWHVWEEKMEYADPE